jgi:hypothetical protein
VDYADVVQAVFPARDDGVALPAVVTDASPARRLRDACEPVAMHAVWCRATNEALAELGLDFLTGYIGGRAAYLGDPAGAVAAASFAWFEPSMIAASWEAATTMVTRDRLVEVRNATVTSSLRAVLGLDDPTGVADALVEAVTAADGAGRPLFSGLRSTGIPADPVLRLWWACDLVREHRGDSHIAAANAAGVDAVQMSILTELWLGMPLLSYTATRGWPEDRMRAAVTQLQSREWIADGALREPGRAAREQIEAATDLQEHDIVTTLGTRLDDVCGQLNEWGQRCIEQGAFPADILKRAAG